MPRADGGRGGPQPLENESAVFWLPDPRSGLSTPGEGGQGGTVYGRRVSVHLLRYCALPDIAVCLQHLDGLEGPQVFSRGGQQAAAQWRFVTWAPSAQHLGCIQAASALLND